MKLTDQDGVLTLIPVDGEIPAQVQDALGLAGWKRTTVTVSALDLPPGIYEVREIRPGVCDARVDIWTTPATDRSREFVAGLGIGVTPQSGSQP